MTIKKLNHRQAQWFLYLVRFNFVLYYHSGKSIEKLNVLSHQPDYEDGSHNNENVVLLKLKFLAVWIMTEIVMT